MKAGIIGAQGSGKSTVFHALTGLAAQPGLAQTKNRARPGQIKVPDQRLDFLEEIYSSKKKVPVELTVIDFAPGISEHKQNAALDQSLIPAMRDLDAMIIIIPDFSANSVDLVAGLEAVEGELSFTDFEQAERRLDRVKKERSADEIERSLLQRCTTHLEQGLPLRTLDLNSQEQKVLSHFCFLSQKPAIVVVNCDPDDSAKEMPAAAIAAVKAHQVDLMRMAAAFEAELWELSEHEREELTKEAGLKGTARDRIIAALYRRLGLITFYTAGEPEAHAWALPAGSSALEAAGRIHSDIARGFIRAEVMGYDDFAELRSEQKVKAAGKFRLEGKDYLMRDGDIIHIRFKI